MKPNDNFRQPFLALFSLTLSSSLLCLMPGCSTTHQPEPTAPQVIGQYPAVDDVTYKSPVIVPIAKKPRLAVIFEEQVRGVFGMSGSWMEPGRAEEALIAKLVEAGYDVVDSKTVRANIMRDQAVMVLGGDQKASIAVGSRLEAPFIIAGKGFAKSAGAILGSSMKSLQANVSLRMVNSQNGQVVASVVGTAAKPHVDEVIGGGEALAAASEQAADKLLEAMSKYDYSASTFAGRIKINIANLRSYRHYLAIKEWIQQNAPGFKGIENENYTTGEASLEVLCNAKGAELAGLIANARFNGFVINPIDVSDSALTLKPLPAK